MGRTLKTLRSRGSRTCGKGRQAKTGAGGRGGTGNAGSFTHKFISRVLNQKKAKANRKVLNLRDLEPRLESFCKKGLLRRKLEGSSVYYQVSEKFAKKYKKILGQGELSFKLKVTPIVKVSKSAKAKIL